MGKKSWLTRRRLGLVKNKGAESRRALHERVEGAPAPGTPRAAINPTVGFAKPRRRAEKAPLSTRQSASTKKSKEAELLSTPSDQAASGPSLWL